MCTFTDIQKFSSKRYSTFSVVSRRNAKSEAACLFDTPTNILFFTIEFLIPIFKSLHNCYLYKNLPKKNKSTSFGDTEKRTTIANKIETNYSRCTRKQRTNNQKQENHSSIVAFPTNDQFNLFRFHLFKSNKQQNSKSKLQEI